MKLFVDLHIHTCLSPCGDDDMTPNDVIAMAKLKGLDAIAITDHNSCRNLKAVEEIIEDEEDLLVVPGLEVTTLEDIHVLCYFPNFERAYAFSDMVYDRLAPFVNKRNIFGRQIVMDSNDREIDTVERLLIGTTDMDISTVARLCRQYGGVPVPAHINKQSSSVLVVLGSIPKDCNFRTVEVHKGSAVPEISLEEYKILYSSDAHSLGHILEREFELEVEERSVKGILDALR